MNKENIKKLNPIVFEKAMEYISLDKRKSKGCCSVILDSVADSIHSFHNSHLYYRYFYLLFKNRLCDSIGNYWWGKKVTFKSQTARIIALQLTALILKEEQSKIK